MEDLNNKCLFRNYPVFSSIKWRCLLLCILSTAFGFIWAASFVLNFIYGNIFKTNWMMNMVIGLPLLFCICPCGLLIIYGCRRRVTNLSSLSLFSPHLSYSSVVFFCSLCFYIIFQYCKKCNIILKLSKDIHFVVLSNNLRFYRSSKCLVYFDQSTLTKPTVSFLTRQTLNIIKYYVHFFLKKLKPLD